GTKNGPDAGLPGSGVAVSTPRVQGGRPPGLVLLVAQGLQGSPGAGGELQVEVDVGVVEFQAGELADPLQPVLQGALVHGQLGGGRVVVAAVLQVLGERVDQFGLAARVVVQQAAQPFADERVHVAQVRDGGQHPEDAELGIVAG